MQQVEAVATDQVSTHRRPLNFSGMSVLLWSAGTVMALLLLLPTLYLLLRAMGADEGAWQSLLRMRTLMTLGRTVGLAAAVTGLAALFAVPLAWLTVRTDLPGARLWATLASLPLVIPSYVGAYLIASALGPRGILQGWLEWAFGVARLPSLYGFPGALLTLTILSYPYLFLAVRATLLRLDPALEQQPPALRLDQDRRPNPGQHRQLLHPN